jgi:hypothetical protein
MIMRWPHTAVLIVAAMVPGCSDHGPPMPTNGGKSHSSSRRPTVADVTEQLRSALSPGASDARVNEVLKGIGLEYDYDEFDNRYSGTLPASRYTENQVKSVIMVRVYLNKDRSFSRFTVEEILTHR